MSILNIFNELPTIVNFLFFLAGVAILIKGSDFFIDAAVFYAKKFHVSEVIIGLTLVSIGTSLPELATNINAAIKGRNAIAVGNVAGSNITNIALIIGISAAVVGKLTVPKKLAERDSIIMLISSAVLLIFSYFFEKSGYSINRLESGIMFLMLIAYLVYLFKFNKTDIELEAHETDELKIKSVLTAILFLIGGLIAIIMGSELMVRNIIAISDKFKISDGIIGATIVALATSFPELSVTIVGIMKKKSEISLGNIIGSNIFNILGVLGITGLIKSSDIIDPLTNQPDYALLFWTLPLMMIVSILLFVMMLIKKQLNRISGIVFLLIYSLFLIFSFIGIPIKM